MEDVNASNDFIEHHDQPSLPLSSVVFVQQEPSIAVDASAVVNEQEAGNMVEVQVAQEENKQDHVEEEKKQEEQRQQQPEATDEQNDAPGTTFGYDNELLIALGLDPATIGEIPEDLRNELFASLDLPPPNRA